MEYLIIRKGDKKEHDNVDGKNNNYGKYESRILEHYFRWFIVMHQMIIMMIMLIIII